MKTRFPVGEKNLTMGKILELVPGLTSEEDAVQFLDDYVRNVVQEDGFSPSRAREIASRNLAYGIKSVVTDAAVRAKLLRWFPVPEVLPNETAAWLMTAGPKGRSTRKRLIEDEVLKDYTTVAGRIVEIHRADCEPRGGGELVGVSFDPPALGRVVPYRDGDTAMLKRWTDDEHCDPLYQVELVEWHPELAARDLNPSWCYGRSWSLEGRPAEDRNTDVVLADEATQARLAHVPGLRFGELESAEAAVTPTVTARERDLWVAALLAARNACSSRSKTHAASGEYLKAEEAQQCALIIANWIDASDEEIEGMLRTVLATRPDPQAPAPGV